MFNVKAVIFKEGTKVDTSEAYNLFASNCFALILLKRKFKMVVFSVINVATDG